MSANAASPTTTLCHATNARGGPCRYPVVPGAAVCRFHGGGAPQVRRKAALRLLELVDPAIATLAREMATASKSADRQRAANSILDRAGVPRTVSSVDVDTAKALLYQRLMELRDEQDDGNAPDVIPGQVIEETNGTTDGVPEAGVAETPPAEPEGP